MAIKGIAQSIVDGTDDPVPVLTDTGTVLMDVEPKFSSDNVLTVSAKIVNISGTTAGSGTVEWSLNGTDYSKVTDSATLTLLDGSTIIWEFPNTGATKYRVKFAGSGTHTSTCSGQFIYK